MLSSAEIIECVAEAVRDHRLTQLVVDPVMVAKGGAKLLQDDAVEALRRRLLPLAAVVTPNLPEAEVLLGRRVATLDDQRRAARAAERGETYELTPEECGELQQEGIQYYHRYLSLFQINEFQGVIRDTQRNLDLFAFVDEHSEREEVIWSFQQFRPYVLMMNTRAKTSIQLAEGKFSEAIQQIESGREAIAEFFQQSSFPELVTKSSEIAFLDEWLEEVRAKRPLSKLEVMEREMERAVASEMYERAAELRDAIKLLKTRDSV
jgi:hypothetical protein